MSRALVRLVSGRTEAILGTQGGMPELLRLGPATRDAPPAELFDELVPPAGLDAPAGPTLVAEPARGWFGEPGLALSRGGAAIAPLLRLVDTDSATDRVTHVLGDPDLEVEVRVDVRLEASGALVLSASVTNLGRAPLAVDALNLTVPVPDELREIVTFGGRHAMEFCEERVAWGRSVVSVGSRRGRTSHQASPVVLLTDGGNESTRGTAWGIHLAWCGNHRIVCDGVSADRRTVTAGEPLSAGEIVLARGQTHSTPDVIVVSSDAGKDGVTDVFHAHLRSVAGARSTPRPVIVNTWEAVYFDHDTGPLFELARRAAAVGAERFVLDDGWFLGRRSDRAGLGDWVVDRSVWPDGLDPLVAHVHSLGMDFGIWIEPEMVNPDSMLYRDHPEWVLGDAFQHEMTGRNQLVLDMANPDVRDHLFSRIDALLRGIDVAHVKWDHNRDLVTSRGHGQATGYLDLLSRLRAAHPGIDFESCASGGGRIDGATARHATRFWTSDSIDALDRLSIQRGAVRLVPPEMLGAHIGAPVCHTTGRRHPLSFRALSALPFWLGVEWDLLSASEVELARLADVIAVHKRHRHLFHSGTTRLPAHPDPLVHVHAVLAPDRSEAMVVVASTGSGPRHRAAPVRVPDLDPAALYRCSLVPLGSPRWALHRGLPSWIEDSITVSGAHLAAIGLPLPPLLPAAGILVRMERVE